MSQGYGMKYLFRTYLGSKHQAYRSERECHDSSGKGYGLLNRLVWGGSKHGEVQSAVRAYRTRHLFPHWEFTEAGWRVWFLI